MKGHFNSVQKLMLYFNQFSAYNALHICQVQGTVDVDRLTDTARSVLIQLGLASLIVDRKTGTFEYVSAPPKIDCEVFSVPDSLPKSDLLAYAEKELNRHFSDRLQLTPFRFAVFTTLESFYFCVSYPHYIADGYSLAQLMQMIIGIYQKKKPVDSIPVFRLYPELLLRNMMRDHRALAYSLTELVRTALRNQKCTGPAFHEPYEVYSALHDFNMTPTEFIGLKDLAKRSDVTLNQILMALLLRVLSLKKQDASPMTLMNVMNLRSRIDGNAADIFGTYISYLSHIVDRVHDRSVLDIARALKNEQDYALQHGSLYGSVAISYLQSLFNMRPESVLQRIPVWAAVSSMNLNRSWDKGSEQLAMGYWRVTSVVPSIPIMFFPSILGNNMTLLACYGTAFFSQTDLELMTQKFHEEVQLAQSL